MRPRHPDLHRARLIVAAVLAFAALRGLKAREQRRQIRQVFAGTTIPRHVRYQAVRAEAGVSMLNLRDARQSELFDTGPRLRRPRRKKTTTHAAA